MPIIRMKYVKPHRNTLVQVTPVQKAAKQPTWSARNGIFFSHCGSPAVRGAACLVLPELGGKSNAVLMDPSPCFCLPGQSFTGSAEPTFVTSLRNLRKGP